MGISLFHLQLGHLSSYFQISELLVLWPSDSESYTSDPSSISIAPSPLSVPIELELFHWVSWFSSMQTAHDGISQFPQSHQPIPIKLLFTDPYVSYWVYFSGELEHNSCLQVSQPSRQKNAGFIAKNVQTSCVYLIDFLRDLRSILTACLNFFPSAKWEYQILISS